MLELETTELLGFTLAGTPVWLLAGAEPDDDGADGDDDGDDTETGGDDGDDTEGDDNNDTKAKNETDSKVSAARKQAAKYRTKLKPWNSLEQEFGTPEQIRAKLSGATSNEDAESVRREAQNTVTGMQKRLVSATVRSLAADFADPDDAVRFVDLASIEVDADGSIDEDEIQSELESILERKPHLRKTATKMVRRPAPDKSQGPGKNGKKDTPSGTIESGKERMKRLMGQNS